MKKRYSVDLSAQMAECELNYTRLMRLMPDFDASDLHEYGVDSVRLRIEVTERCRFTTMLNISQSTAQAPWCDAPHLSVRIYHDARMAEVTAFQRQRRVEPVNDYPNKRMHHVDEKVQWNNFLGEWLSHCLHNGHSVGAVGVVDG